jgi:hypothetical protein
LCVVSHYFQRAASVSQFAYGINEILAKTIPRNEHIELAIAELDAAITSTSEQWASSLQHARNVVLFKICCRFRCQPNLRRPSNGEIILLNKGFRQMAPEVGLESKNRVFSPLPTLASVSVFITHMVTAVFNDFKHYQCIFGKL